MSTQFSRFRLLGVTGSKGVHFTAPFVGKLESHVSQSTDTIDPYTGSGGHVMDQERGKYSHAAAEERSRFFPGQRLRPRTKPRPLGSNTIRKAAMVSNNGSLSSGAKVLLAGKA